MNCLRIFLAMLTGLIRLDSCRNSIRLSNSTRCCGVSGDSTKMESKISNTTSRFWILYFLLFEANKYSTTLQTKEASSSLVLNESMSGMSSKNCLISVTALAISFFRFRADESLIRLSIYSILWQKNIYFKGL